MPSAKEQIAKILQDQPDDSFYEEILRLRGMDDRPRRDGTPNQHMAELIWTAESERWLRDIHDFIAHGNLPQ